MQQLLPMTLIPCLALSILRGLSSTRVTRISNNRHRHRHNDCNNNAFQSHLIDRLSRGLWSCKRIWYFFGHYYPGVPSGMAFWRWKTTWHGMNMIVWYWRRRLFIIIGCTLFDWCFESYVLYSTIMYTHKQCTSAAACNCWSFFIWTRLR